MKIDNYKIILYIDRKSIDIDMSAIENLCTLIGAKTSQEKEEVNRLLNDENEMRQILIDQRIDLINCLNTRITNKIIEVDKKLKLQEEALARLEKYIR